MKPILFDSDTLDYSNNGIGILYDTIRCEVREERNGIFNLDMEYPIDGEWFSEIKDQRLIMAKPNDVDDPHVFRIFEIDSDLDDGMLYVSATSITDDLGKNLILDAVVNESSADMAMVAIKSNLIEDTPFDLVSDIETKSSTSWTLENPLKAISGSKGSIVSLWGGEIKRTNRAIFVHSRRGKDKVAVIRPGKNIDGFNMRVSTKGMVTRILPYFEHSFRGLTEYEMVEDYDGNIVKQASYTTFEGEVEPESHFGDVVVSGEAHKYPLNYYQPLDLSADEEITEAVDKFIADKEKELEESSTIIDTSGFKAELDTFIKEQVDNKASRYFTYTNPGVDKPNVEMKVDILQLTDSPEWEKYKRLEHMQLTDTVEVYVKKFDVDVEVTISAMTYDSLGERVTDITAGTIRTSLADSISKEYEDRSDALEDSQKYIENGIRNTIGRTADGLNRKFTGYTEPSADVSSEGDIWFKIIGAGQDELYIYNGGRWEPLLSEVQQEKLQQDIDSAMGSVREAKNDANEAVNKANLATQNANDAILDSQEAFDNAQLALTTVGEVESDVQEAFDNAQSALTTAGEAKSDAQSAFDNAQSALTTAGDAWDLANSQTTLISGAVEDSQTALSTANSALSNASDALSTANGVETHVTQEINRIDGEMSSKISNTVFNSLKGTVEDQSTSIQQNATAITKKAESSVVNTINQTVDNHSTLISQNADEITYKASQSSVNTLTGRVETNESDISIQATEISQRMKTTDANAKFATQSQLTSTSDSFTSEILRVEGDLNDLEIGGRNLLGNTGYDEQPEPYQSNITVVEGKPKHAVVDGRGIVTERITDVFAGKEYTLSVEIRTENHTQFGYNYIMDHDEGNSGSIPTIRNVIDDGEWHRYEVTFNSSVTRTNAGIMIAHTSDLPFEVRKLMLVEGNKVGTWQPAPEDIQSQFSVINQTVDSITTRVGDSEENISTLQQTSSSFATRISDSEGDISTLTQTTQGLQTRVSDTEGNISTLTQTADGLQSSVRDVRDDLDNLEIGGRNLFEGGTLEKFTGTSSRKEYMRYANIHHALSKVENGEEITISIDIEMVKGNGLKLYCSNTRGRYYFSPDKTFSNLGTEKQRISFVTTKLEDSNSTSPSTYLELYSTYGSEDWYTASNLKIEKGNKATDWTPAPEDIQSQFSTINQTVDSIATRVGDTEGDISTLTQTVSGLQTEVNSKVDGTTYNTKMTQLDNAIQARITESTANSRFTRQTTFDQTIDGFTSRVETVETDVDKRVREYSLNFPFNTSTDYVILLVESDKTGKNNYVLGELYGHRVSGYYSGGKVEVIFNNNTSGTTPSGSMTSSDIQYLNKWTLITCIYGGKSYIALRHQPSSQYGLWDTDSKFRGMIKSSGEMLRVLQTSSVTSVSDFVSVGDVSTPETRANSQFSTINQTIDSIATRVGDTEGNVSTLTQTVSGLQTRVNNAEGDISTVTQLAGTLQTKIQDAEGNISTLTQTANSMTNRIGTLENSTGNLVRNPELTRDTSGWNSGNGLTTHVDSLGDFEGAITLRNNTTGKTITYSSWFNVDPAKTYEVSMWVRKNASRGRWYLGVHGSNTSSYDNNSEFIRVSTSSGSIGISSTNSYFVTSGGNARNTWTKISGYLFPIGTDGKDMVDLGDGNNYNLMMDPKLKRMRIRWLNYDNGGTNTYMYVANPKVVEVSSGAFSQTSQLKDNINLRVKKDDVINQINISDENILISGKKLLLNGDTTVYGSFTVTNANISSVSASKMTTGTLDAGKVTLTNLTGLNIYGSKFRSSTGSDFMEITGGNIRLQNSNGRYLQMSPTGFYGYNSGGSVRFKADSTLVTSSAFGTSNDNVYLAGQAGKEGRVVDMRDIPSDGEIASYRYLPLRASGYYGNFVEVNSGASGINLYLRPRSGGEVRVTGANTTDAYYPLRAGAIHSNSFISTSTSLWMGTDSAMHVVSKGYVETSAGDPTYRDVYAKDYYARAYITQSTHAYIGTDNELRVVNKGLSSIYRNVRANEYYGIAFDLGGHSSAKHLYVRPALDGEVRITGRTTTSNYRPIRADSFPTGSSEQIKENISPFEGNALSLINSSVIYDYNRKATGNRELGFIIEREIPEIVKFDNESVNGYTHRSLNTKAIQELDHKVNEELSNLREQNEYYILKLAKLEQKINKLEASV